MKLEQRMIKYPLILICLLFVSVIFSIDNGLSSILYKVSGESSSNAIHKNGDIASTRICCFILTSTAHFKTRTKAVEETWASRCNHHFYISEPISVNASEVEKSYANKLPIAPFPNILPGRDHLTQKSVHGFMYSYERYYNACDWFVKADDDTYLLVNNLRSFLSHQNTTSPITFGYNFKILVSHGFHSGGASYVLSRQALKRLYIALKTPELGCRYDGGPEDVEIARCLRKVNVLPGNSLDRFGRERFHPLVFSVHFSGKYPQWLQHYSMNPLRGNFDCCSDESISFHYTTPDEMYMIDFFLHRVK